MKTSNSSINSSIKPLPFFPGWLFSLLRWPSPETTEWFCLRSAVWWVIQLAPPLHLFAISASFAGLARYGHEAHWQVILGSLLLIQLAAVCLGNLWMRVAALFAFGGIWAFIAGMFWASSPHLGFMVRNTGIGVYASLAVDCFIVAIHLVKLWWIDHLTRQEQKWLACLSRSNGIGRNGIRVVPGKEKQE